MQTVAVNLILVGDIQTKTVVPNLGLTVYCSGSRGSELCADLVGGQNVAMKTLLLRQDASQTEIIVTAYPLKISLFRGNKIIVSPCWGKRRGVHWILKRKQKSVQAFETQSGV